MNNTELFRIIGSISRKATTDVNQAVKSYGLDNNLFLYLMRIVENVGITQSDLVKLIKVDKTTLSRALSKLESLKYIKKKPNDENKNFNELYPTQKAKELYKVLHDIENQYIGKALANLTPLELTYLKTGLWKIDSTLS